MTAGTFVYILYLVIYLYKICTVSVEGNKWSLILNLFDFDIDRGAEVGTMPLKIAYCGGSCARNPPSIVELVRG
jgi:hypothetical protein